MKKWQILSFVVIFSGWLAGCYTFQGISIPVEAETCYVETFTVRAPEALPNLGQTLSEALKDRIRNESNLKFSDVDPHLEFKGTVTEYRVSAQAPQSGEQTAFNRLSVTVSVEYINHLKEDDAWTTNFPYFSDFGSDQNLIDVQDQLIDEIKEQLIIDIFNKAFNNW